LEFYYRFFRSVKNIFIFIRIYFNFISFVALQICCILILNKYSKTHEVYFAGITNEMVGKVNKKYDNVYSYLNLQQINNQLAQENARLRDSLKSSSIIVSSKVDSTSTFKPDSASLPIRKYSYLYARVVGNYVSSPINMLTLERGRLQGVEKDMAVVGPQGIVGEVVEVSDNYCRVKSLLHRKSSVSAMLKRDKNAGNIEWDGVNPSYVLMKNIPKSAKIFKGDTVVTSTYSNYPPNVMVGTIEAIRKDNSSNFFTLKLKTATNFFNLQYVYVVKNYRYNEQHMLEESKLKLND